MTDELPIPPGLPTENDPVVVHDESDLRVTVVQVGWVAVRKSHARYRGPWPLRYGAIAMDPRWHAWLPVNVTVVEHGTGVLLVDTGEAVDQPPGHFGCGDQVQEWVYRTYLRLPVRRGQDAPSRLRALGIAAQDVDIVVITHLHGDHTGNLTAFPRARVLAGPGEAAGYPGAITARLRGRNLITPHFPDGTVGDFPKSLCLVPDDTIRAIPLPGHTVGHIGVGITGARSIFIAGDSALTYDQLRSRGTPGIALDRTANQHTQDLLCAVLDSGGYVVLSHDRPPQP
ncbi:MBL fold metallo-hydrolase [Amycolatopsis sp. NPDC004378]